MTRTSAAFNRALASASDLALTLFLMVYVS